MVFSWNRNRQDTATATNPANENISISNLLNLPAEIRIRIFSHLIQVAPATSIPHRAAAHEQGYTSGVGHVNSVQYGTTWRSVTIAKPPGFALTAPAILRASKLIHNEVMDLLYSKMLWVINIQDLRPSSQVPFGSDDKTNGIVASPEKKSMFLQWIDHVHVRQHIRPEEDLIQKAQTLRSLLDCLNVHRKSLQVTFHFDSIHLVNDPEYPREKKAEYNWKLYENELRRMDLGATPHFRVSSYWLESEGEERFAQLAASVGGEMNSRSYIYW
ncbi:hypothetical protein CB0940_04314 [Cercospora beticola]|uniref:F-box domain-containing protein n=1 Tax=Cercospora beticola TaxID=122368 RepID=A0A2G5HL31_CERBT|nr:hypothetical protein CB0940_04314 [Cercospora beticola]PIA93225.1 hypothetical protein CB0940_04314 [Cercospora beticola]WPB01544.1 hypothetical protein RHO25_006171 [Cercospora beticola]CAK1363664.1 unnamed protein product [Cercospora beticola]